MTYDKTILDENESEQITSHKRFTLSTGWRTVYSICHCEVR